MDQQWSYAGSKCRPNCTFPNLFIVSNEKKGVDDDKVKNIRYSLYGTVGGMNYDGPLFLEAPFSNDWTSALHPDNRSYF